MHHDADNSYTGGGGGYKFYIITYILDLLWQKAARSKESKSSSPEILTPAADIE